MEFVDVSVIMPFADHEQVVGSACRRIAEYFRSAGMVVDIIAVDQGSGDNSQPVLQLLRSEIPELRMIMGRNYASGVGTSHAPVLVLLTPEQAANCLCSSLANAVWDISRHEADMQLVDEHLLVCSRDCADLIVKTSPQRLQMPRKLFQRGRARGARVRSYGPEAPRSRTGRISQVIAAVVPLAAGLHRAP